MRAATALAEGRTVETAELVVSLRNFIREVLDLDPMPAELAIPKQGPLRPVAGASRGAGRGEASTGGAAPLGALAAIGQAAAPAPERSPAAPSTPTTKRISADSRRA